MYKPQQISRLRLPWSCALLAILACLLSSTAYATTYQKSAIAVDHQEVPYSESLRKNMLRHGEPRIIQLTERVYVAYAYDWANFMLVEGDDGIIVIDAGMHEESSARALDDFRKMAKTDKPIAAVFYTHGHADHTGGVRAFVPKGKEKDIPVYAASNWAEYQDNQVSPNFIWNKERAELQFDLDRTFDEDKDMSSLFNIFPNSYASNIGYVEPNHVIDFDGGLQELTISGVRMEIYPIYGEMLDTLMITLVDDRVLHTSDSISDLPPAMFTPRLLGDRDPEGIVRANEYMMSVVEAGKVDHVYMGHGDTESGTKEELLERIKNFRDTIRTVLDQVSYLTGQGYSMNETAERVRLPDHLNNDPNLNVWWHHPLLWHARQAYTVQSGWFSGNPRDMIRPLPTKEAKLMVKLVGGPDKLLKEAKQAFKDGENGWAVQLADYLLKVDKHTEEAKKVQAKAFFAQAALVDSGTEYNYYVSKGKKLEGRFREGGIKKIFAVEHIPRRSAVKDMIEVFIARFDMAKGEFENLPVTFHITDTGETWGVHIDRGVLLRQAKAFDNAEGEVSLTKLQLFQLVMGVKTPEALNLTVKGDQARVTQFFRILGL